MLSFHNGQRSHPLHTLLHCLSLATHSFCSLAGHHHCPASSPQSSTVLLHHRAPPYIGRWYQTQAWWWWCGHTGCPATVCSPWFQVEHLLATNTGLEEANEVSHANPGYWGLGLCLRSNYPAIKKLVSAYVALYDSCLMTTQLLLHICTASAGRVMEASWLIHGGFFALFAKNSSFCFILMQ